ncbi:MAG: ABC transporter ATP-binding protein [Hyphomicrobiales bacterium]|nr:MAG: ABC transporter ATP-binding protein [Hyphomicrobiales bacterium]
MDLSLRNIVKRFGALTALDAVSLDVPVGTFVCFLGPSGCGKTTLLRVIAGLETAEEGEIRLGAADLSRVPARERNFGVVFQSYSLFPNMTAARNVAYGLECRGWKKPDANARVDEMLRLVHLSDHDHKLPSQLSGGQQQRVALARAIAPNPSLLLLDEPLSALDAKVREGLRGEIRAVQHRLGITTIMVTHDQEEALAMADLIVVMRAGRIEQIGSPSDLYERPETSFVADFIGRMNLLPTAANGDGRAAFAGTPLEVTGATVEPGTTLGIRPEAIAIEPAGAAGANRVAGSVAEVVFLGNLTRVFVTPQGAAGDISEPLMVEVHGPGAMPAIGDAVTLHLPADTLRVLA